MDINETAIVQQPFFKSRNFYSKLALFFGFISIAMVYNNPFILFGFLILTVVLCMAAGLKIETLLSTAKSVIGIFIFLLIFSAFIYDVGTAKLEIAKKVYFTLFTTKFMTVALTSGGMLTGLAFIIKMMIMIFASSFFSHTTTVEEMLYGLNKMGLPYQFGLMLSIALRFIPTLKKEVNQIQQAQKSRGAMTKKLRKDKGGKGAAVQGIIPLFVPMIVSSMRRSDTMAMSMTSRGYGFSNKRTQMLDINFGIVQIMVSLVVIIFIGLCIYIKKKYGFGVL